MLILMWLLLVYGDSMANCMFGFPNFIDSATLSGGSFTSTLPITNIQTRKIQQVAQTTDLTLSNTKINIDLGQLRNIGIFTAVNHNFSLQSTYRLRGSRVSDFSTTEYDSGSTFLEVWPVVYPYGSIPWENPSWFGGKYTDDQIARYNANLTVILPYATIARYWRLEISDINNSAGVLQLGRIFIGSAWQPTNNMAYGEGLKWETDTLVQKTRGGGKVFDVRKPYRVDRYRLDWLSREEAMVNVFEIQGQAGIDKEIMWIFDPDDTSHALRTQFLARFRILSEVEYPLYGNNATAFEVEELK